MANLMTSMYTGISGLNVSQNALNTTAHNLTNVNTAGYVRQQVIIKDWGYENIGQAANYTNQIGLGTATEVVKQVRDRFFDQRYRLEFGRQGYYESQYKAVQEIEDIFGELEGVTFQKPLNDLWNSIQELAKEPDSIVTRTTFAKNAESFIERAETIYEQLQSYQINLNIQLTDKVNRINQLGKEIRDLNVKIRSYEASGQERANDLRDARNNCLDELGGLIDITYKEDAQGMVNISAEGVPFVNDTTVFEMGLKKESETSQMLKPIWKSTDTDVFNFDRVPSAEYNTDIGSLKGLLVARGSDSANYTDIPVREAYPTEEAYQIGVKEYNTMIEASVMRTIQAQFDQLIHGLVTAINDVFAPNKGAILAADVTLPDGKVLTGDSKIKILDEENAPVGQDENHTKGEAMFNRKGMDRYTVTTATVYVLDENGDKIVLDDTDPLNIIYQTETKEIYIYNEEDPDNNYSLFTLGEIEVNKKVMQNYSILPLSNAKTPAAYDNKAVEKLINLWNQSFATLGPNNSTHNTFTTYYTEFIGELSNRGYTLKNITENQEFAVNSLDTDRQNIMGVSSDEELANMLRFQHAYNAASRYVNVISEMLEHIIMRL
ncbi:flagellar hook-associated protein 1 FlgK [Mobilisporobacter senegalensis]|uniref:Flagellar hook-associated protein 1 n=1 Tax=Mobilisporobacter senegalensis TaxID=1329262 RepID=A0A3N1XY76_9FIRM|nr:flagellar hook-associated protein FlgK [Mobilisporobacter senegalensis]ROR31554.1 flagellar hook-associated protein 1 FlgK [Mobilisporobacter senegalensis]